MSLGRSFHLDGQLFTLPGAKVKNNNYCSAHKHKHICQFHGLAYTQTFQPMDLSLSVNIEAVALTRIWLPLSNSLYHCSCTCNFVTFVLNFGLKPTDGSWCCVQLCIVQIVQTASLIKVCIHEGWYRITVVVLSMKPERFKLVMSEILSLQLKFCMVNA